MSSTRPVRVHPIWRILVAVNELAPSQPSERRVRRVGMVVIHSNPLVEPGSGDAGGMTVYVRQVARALASRGIEVDIFTRGGGQASEVHGLADGVRVIEVPAGGPDLDKEALSEHVPEFAANLVSFVGEAGLAYDVIHSHYWLSGRVGSRLARRWGAPMVHTFHTLGRVKNGTLAPGDDPEPKGRLCGESRVIAESDAIVASTPHERCSLIKLYSGHPERIHVVPPGVDHQLFRPGDSEAAKAELGLAGKKVLGFVGRIQPLKGPEVALEAFARGIEDSSFDREDTAMVFVGGPSGPQGPATLAELDRVARDRGLRDAVRFLPARPQHELPGVYEALDVLLVPSRSESFGLVALEALATGVPVIASDVGGLRSVVFDGRTGWLVTPGDATEMKQRAARLVRDRALAGAMGQAAVEHSLGFSWEVSADRLVELYRSTTARLASTG